jgi:hypothetical protein
LLALQDQDVLADQLRYRMGHLPQHSELHAAEAAFSDLSRRALPSRQEREIATQRQRELEVEIDEVSERIRTIERRLQTDTGGSFRDQTAMATEIRSLSDRKNQLEESELEVMEVAEPLDKELGIIDAEQAGLAAKAKTLLGEIKVAEAEVQSELDSVVRGREQLTANVPERLRNEYERLRVRLGGIGAARVIHGMCSGCNLALRDRARPSAPRLARDVVPLRPVRSHPRPVNRILG